MSKAAPAACACVSQGHLRLDAGAGHRDRHRHAPGHVSGDPIDQGVPLGLGELVDLGTQAEDRNAVGAAAEAALHLAAHGRAIQPPVAGEERVLHRIDARQMRGG